MSSFYYETLSNKKSSPGGVGKRLRKLVAGVEPTSMDRMDRMGEQCEAGSGR
jgi:hypothetical protein